MPRGCRGLADTDANEHPAPACRGEDGAHRRRRAEVVPDGIGVYAGAGGKVVQPFVDALDPLTAGVLSSRHAGVTGSSSEVVRVGEEIALSRVLATGYTLSWTSGVVAVVSVAPVRSGATLCWGASRLNRLALEHPVERGSRNDDPATDSNDGEGRLLALDRLVDGESVDSEKLRNLIH